LAESIHSPNFFSKCSKWVNLPNFPTTWYFKTFLNRRLRSWHVHITSPSGYEMLQPVLCCVLYDMLQPVLCCLNMCCMMLQPVCNMCCTCQLIHVTGTRGIKFIFVKTYIPATSFSLNLLKLHAFAHCVFRWHC